MGTLTFEDLAGDEQVFFSEYFNRRPLLRQRAVADPRDVLSIADLDHLLNSEAIRPPYLRIAKGGRTVLTESFTRLMRVQGEHVTDAIDADRVVGHFRTGATLTWNSLNQFLPKIRDLTVLLSRRFATRSDVIAFLTPAGKRGFSPHYDPVDLFILQTEGTKFWQVWNPPAHRPGDYAHFSAEQLGEPEIELVLEPGDVLYLPYNTPHVAAAENAVSLHLSIMIRPHRWPGLLEQIVHSLVSGDKSLWDYPYLNESNRAELVTKLTGKLAYLQRKLADANPDKLVSELIAWGRDADGSRVEPSLSRLARADTLEATSRLRLRPMQLLPRRENDGAALFLDGCEYRVSDAVAHVLRGFDTGDEIEAGRIAPGRLAEESLQLAQQLMRIGAIEETS